MLRVSSWICGAGVMFYLVRSVGPPRKTAGKQADIGFLGILQVDFGLDTREGREATKGPRTPEMHPRRSST